MRLTGEPAFSSEIGVAMEYDLSGSISITLGLIGILFWWMQRRFSLLLGLVGVLVIVFAVALGIAGWLYGELSIMALSSIEILIGLAVDYGLVICQEAKVAGHDRKALLKSCGKPVAFGALTTTVVFLALNLGGLPGMAQLGSIVAIGLSAAAILSASKLLRRWPVSICICPRSLADSAPTTRRTEEGRPLRSALSRGASSRVRVRRRLAGVAGHKSGGASPPPQGDNSPSRRRFPTVCNFFCAGR